MREDFEIPLSELVLEFLGAAASRGVWPEMAVRLATERALVLSDAGELGIHAQSARRLLTGAAASAQADLALGPEQSGRVRELLAARPVALPALSGTFNVGVPECLLARARNRIETGALHPAVVGEMITWELAARLQARTMCEWGLFELARASTR